MEISERNKISYMYMQRKYNNLWHKRNVLWIQMFNEWATMMRLLFFPVLPNSMHHIVGGLIKWNISFLDAHILQIASLTFMISWSIACTLNQFRVFHVTFSYHLLYERSISKIVNILIPPSLIYIRFPRKLILSFVIITINITHYITSRERLRA